MSIRRNSNCVGKPRVSVFQNVLIFTNIFLVILYYKKLSNFLKISSLLIILAFLGTEIVAYFRTAQVVYDIFTDFFLLISLALILKNIFDIKKSRIFSLIMMVFLFSLNYDYMLTKSSSDTTLKLEDICNKETSITNFWNYWHKSISKNRIAELCDWSK